MCHMLCTRFVNVLLYKGFMFSIWKIAVSHLVLCLHVNQSTNPRYSQPCCSVGY